MFLKNINMEKRNSHNSSETIKENKNTELNKLRLVFEQTPGSIFILDKNFRFEYVNPNFTKLSGYTKEELLNRTVEELFYPKDLPDSRKEIIENLLKGEKWQGELPIFNKIGSTYWANTIAAPYKDEAGNIDGYIIIQQDITEKRRMQVSLEESEKLYRTLIESSLEAVTLNQDGRFLLVNKSFCKLFGFSEEEVFSMNPQELIAQEDREMVMDLHFKRMNGEVENLHYTASFLHKSGKKILTELNATTVQVNGRNASLITMSDITENKRIELELKKSERRYRELAEMLPLAVYELDISGKPTYMNRTGLKLLGLEGQSSGEKNATSFFSPKDSTRMKQRLQEEANRMLALNGLVEAIPSPPDEYTAINSEGKEVPVLIYGTAIIEDGHAVGSRGVIVDISERKAMENALRESEEKYKTLIENSQDGIFAIIDDKILFANNTFCKMVGFTPNELYDKSAFSLVHLDDLARGLAISALRKQGNHSTINDIFRFIAKDGSIKEVDVFSSVMELNGQMVSYITVHDLTETRKIQEELIKSEQKYRELSEMLPQTVYELDLNANLKYLNKAGREKFGTAYETGDVSVFSIVIPEELEQMKRNFAIVSFKNIPSKGNFYKLRQVDGQIFEAMISATPMIVDGKTVGQRGVVIDISDHVAMQKALAESEEKYRNLIENATDGIVITQDGLMKFYNRAMADMLEIDNLNDVDIPFLDRVMPEDHQRMIDFHKRRMSGEDFNALYRSRMIRKDGKIITVELNARTSNYNGKPAAFIVIRDITDRVKIEDELQIAKNELEKLNSQLEKRVKESSKRLTEARTQLINLQKENLQSQFDVLKQQVNPHFLFNSLNVLTSLIKLEPDLAEKFSEQLSKVYRYVLENKDNELVDLNTELNFLDAYIFLLNIRFVGKLNVNLLIPDENRNDKIIPLAMQLLIENAIKHNVMSKSNPLVIDIFIDSANCLNIINNLQERPSQIVSTGVGLKNILNRYKLLVLPIPTFEKSKNQFIAKIKLIK